MLIADWMIFPFLNSSALPLRSLRLSGKTLGGITPLRRREPRGSAEKTILRLVSASVLSYTDKKPDIGDGVEDLIK